MSRRRGRPTTSIVFVVVTYRRAGTEEVVLRLSQAARERGWQVTAIVPPSSMLDQYEEELRRVGADVLRIGPLFERHRSPLRNFARLYRAFRSRQADVVHFHMPWAPTCFEAILAAWLARASVRIRTEHNPIMDRLSLRQRTKLRVLDHMVHKIVCVSRGNLARHVSNGGRRAGQITVIWNGIGPAESNARVDPRALRAELGLPESAVVRVTIGALEERKGVFDLVSVATKCHGAVLVSIGDGELRERAMAMAAARGTGDRLIWLGARADVRRLLPAFDVYVQPSHYEGLSISMLEGLAAGLPMVTTDVDGVDDVLNGIDGEVQARRRVHAVGDTTSIAQSIDALATDAKERARLGTAMQERVSAHFTVERMCATYLALYDDLLADAGQPARPGSFATMPPDA